MSNRLEAKHLAVPDLSVFKSGLPVNEYEIRRQAEAMRAIVVGEYVGHALKAIGRFFGSFAKSVRQARMMSELAQLDDRTLADIGIRRSDIASYVNGDWKSADVAKPMDSVKSEGTIVAGRLAA